jgi:hypothetical protein
VIGAALYVLLLVGIVCAALAVREEFDRIRRVRHYLALMQDEEQR